jgi:N-glycosylase/DNA lyase
MPGSRWGRFDSLFTPAFWASRMWIDDISPGSYRIGQTLAEEVVACLLGGYGMPAEMGLQAFERLKHWGLLRPKVSVTELESALSEPFRLGSRLVRYRYPRQKARYAASALCRLDGEDIPQHSLELRNWLLSFDGIGLKTASWITRNTRGCDEVAILDVHIHRAGLLMGIFSKEDSVQRNYLGMERRLVEFAKALGVRLSALDDLIWRYMKSLNRTALACIEARGA